MTWHSAYWPFVIHRPLINTPQSAVTINLKGGFRGGAPGARPLKLFQIRFFYYNTVGGMGIYKQIKHICPGVDLRHFVSLILGRGVPIRIYISILSNEWIGLLWSYWSLWSHESLYHAWAGISRSQTLGACLVHPDVRDSIVHQMVRKMFNIPQPAWRRKVIVLHNPGIVLWRPRRCQIWRW